MPSINKYFVINSTVSITRNNIAIVLLPIIFSCLILKTASQQLLVGYVVFFGILSLLDRRFFVSSFSVYYLILEFFAVPFLYVFIFFVAVTIIIKDLLFYRLQIQALRIERPLYAFVFICYFSLLVNGNYQSFGLLVAFTMNLIVYYVISQILVSRKDNLILVFFPIAAVAAFTALVSINEFDTLTGRISLLGVTHEDRAGTIGRLATVCIIGALMSLIMLFSTLKRKLEISFYIACFICSLYGLFLTQSRGQLLALFASVFIASVVLYKDQIIPLLWNIKFLVSMVFLVLVILAYFYFFYFDTSSLMVVNRLTSDNLDNATNLRISIWMSGLKTLEGFMHLLFGGGVNNFKVVSLQNFYAHSVFVDVLYSLGLSGFLFLSWIVFKQGLLSVKVKSFSALSLLLLVCINNITHGQLNTINFWFVLFLSVAITTCLRKNRMEKNGS